MQLISNKFLLLFSIVSIAASSLTAQTLTKKQQDSAYLVNPGQERIRKIKNWFVEKFKEELKKKIKIKQKQNEHTMSLLFQVIDDSSGELNKYYYKLGQHFVSLQDYKAAEKFYMKANMHKQASLASQSRTLF